MRTPNERIAELEEQVEQLQKEKTAAVSAAYGIVLAALSSLRDNRIIQGVHLKLAKEAMELKITETLSDHPDLLEAVRWGYFPRRWK